MSRAFSECSRIVFSSTKLWWTPRTSSIGTWASALSSTVLSGSAHRDRPSCGSQTRSFQGEAQPKSSQAHDWRRKIEPLCLSLHRCTSTTRFFLCISRLVWKLGSEFGVSHRTTPPGEHRVEDPTLAVCALTHFSLFVQFAQWENLNTTGWNWSCKSYL